MAYHGRSLTLLGRFWGSSWPLESSQTTQNHSFFVGFLLFLVFGLSIVVLALLKAILVHLGLSWGLRWAILSPYLGTLGPSCGYLGPSWGCCGPSWAQFGVSWGPLGATLGQIAAVVGHLGSTSACHGRSSLLLRRVGDYPVDILKSIRSQPSLLEPFLVRSLSEASRSFAI